VLQAALVLKRDRDREGRETMQEIGGAIERIDDPNELVVAAAPAFFSENRVLRMAAANALRSMSVTKSLRPLLSIFKESRRERLLTIKSPARRAARMPILSRGCIVSR
jgi:hypothetical protein